MATTFGLRNRASTLLGLSLTGLLLLPTRVRAHDLSPDTLTLFGVGATGKATLSDPTGCTANLQVFIQDTNIVAVTPLSASSVVSQVFTVTALRVGSTVVRIDFAGDTPLCTEVGSKFLTVQVVEPPVITQQPVGQAAAIGSDVTFSVAATGNLLRYQWRLNGVHIPGATASSLTLTNVQVTNSGDYSVTVYNPAGVVNSAKAALVVTPVVDLPFTDGFVNLTNIISGAIGVGRGKNVGATRQTGEPFHAGKRGNNSVWLTWRPPFNGIAEFSTLGSSFDTLLAVYTGNTLSALTEEASDNDSGGFHTSRLKFYAAQNAVYHIAVDGFYNAQGDIVLSWNLIATSVPLPRFTSQPSDQSGPVDDRVSLDVNYQVSEQARVQWFRYEVLVRDVSAGGSDSLVFSALKRSNVGNYFCRIVPDSNPNDALREVRSRPVRIQIHVRGDGAVLRNVFTRDAFLEAADLLSLPPAGQALQKAERGKHTGGPATGYTGTQIFSTFGSTKDPGEPDHCGVPGGASEWYSYAPPTNGLLRITTEGSDFDTVLAVYTGPGTDFASLVLEACDNDGGSNGRTSAVMLPGTTNQLYYIAVDGVDGATGTVQLNYDLGVAPVILQPPVSQTVTASSNVTLTVIASGNPLAYQWRRNGVDIPNATNSSLAITNFQGANQGGYRVVVSNFVGSAISSAALLLLDAPLRFGAVSDGGDPFSLQLAGQANTNYIVQASTNLINWVSLATNNSPYGFWNYVDADSSNFNHRFYRAFQSP